MKLKLLFLSVFTLLCAFAFSSTVFAQGKVFTAQELAQFDGKDGRPAYYAYEGKVYDVTGSRLWEEGEHFGLQAGQDLTGKMGEAPHGTEVFAGFSVMGTFGAQAASSAPKATCAPRPACVDSEPRCLLAEPAEGWCPITIVGGPVKTIPTQKKWYESRIQPFGISILGWSGILLGIVFVFNFATCFAMPWSKVALPWKGQRPGTDGLDAAPTHMNFASIHKHFVWATVILGMLHGILGLLQLIGIYL